MRDILFSIIKKEVAFLNMDDAQRLRWLFKYETFMLAGYLEKSQGNEEESALSQYRLGHLCSCGGNCFCVCICMFILRYLCICVTYAAVILPLDIQCYVSLVLNLCNWYLKKFVL